MKLSNPFNQSARIKQPARPSAKAKQDYAIKQQTISKIKALLESNNPVILDTETTGIPRGDEDHYITELSIIDMKGRTLFSSLLAIAIPVPEKITEITGIDDSMLKGKPSFDAVYEDIREILRGRTVLGWNVSFDALMLKIECERLGYSNPVEDCIDVMALYGNATAGKKWCKLAKAAEELKIEGEQEHRSLGDCLMTLEVLKRFSADTQPCSVSKQSIDDTELPF